MATSENPAQDGQAVTILSGTKKRRPGRPRKIIPDVDQAIAKIPTAPKLNLSRGPELTLQNTANAPLLDQENRRQTRTRKQPNRFVSFVHVLLLLTLMTVFIAESPILNGVHFQKEAPIIFSDSEWIISTDVKFTDIQSNLKFLRQKVSGLDLNDFLAPRPKDLAIIKHNAQYGIYTPCNEGTYKLCP